MEEPIKIMAQEDAEKYGKNSKEIDFGLAKALEPVFTAIDKCNNFLKKDDVIGHRYNIDILNLHCKLKKASTMMSLTLETEKKNQALGTAVEMALNMQQSIAKEFGIGEKKSLDSLILSFLHPVYKAKIWLDPTQYDEFLAQFINGEETTKEFYAKQDAKNGCPLANFTQEELGDLPESYKMMLEIEALERQQLKNRGKEVPPIRAEVDNYLAMYQFKEDMDVLAWWKEQEAELPLLAQLARRLLAVPIAAATSIKPLQADGLLFWHNSEEEMSDEMLLKLIFIQQNHNRIPMDMSHWDLTPQVNNCIHFFTDIC